MGGSLLGDAFGHHVWATLTLIDACGSLGPEQLTGRVDGTYGSIIETTRHLVGADCWYLYALTGGRHALVDDEHMDLAELRAEMADHAEAWSALLAEDLDPEAVVVRHRDDGSETHAPAGIRLAQVLHHGSDHRSHICTVLTTLGVEPPMIDVWDYGAVDGRVVEIPPTTP
jgi:uncharacterized damage-inducible protein DinB